MKTFANFGLPYDIGGEIAERKKRLVATPEMLRSRFMLDVRIRSSVEAIDRTAKTVRVRALALGEGIREGRPHAGRLPADRRWHARDHRLWPGRVRRQRPRHPAGRRRQPHVAVPVARY